MCVLAVHRLKLRLDGKLTRPLPELPLELELSLRDTCGGSTSSRRQQQTTARLQEDRQHTTK
jgi:hypothetical protein